MYIGGYGIVSKLCLVCFLVVGESMSVLLLYVVMSYVNCGDVW